MGSSILPKHPTGGAHQASETNLPSDKQTTNDANQHHDWSYLPDASPCVQAMSGNNCESSGRKRALCIGINYREIKIVFERLNGCIKDATDIRAFLMLQGYKADDIRMLTDDTKVKPTKENIIEAMSWLVQGAEKGDSLFFHYSGHGHHIADQNGDEVDGQDEDIICYDSSPFIDDDIRETLVDPLPAGCRLTALFDSCHSGTILDLPYTCDSDGRPQREYPPSKTDPLANVICWSGATDDQNCADTLQGGVMTQAFINSLKEQSNQSYKELLRSLRRKVIEGNLVWGNQIPQLTSSYQIDTNMKFSL